MTRLLCIADNENEPVTSVQPTNSGENIEKLTPSDSETSLPTDVHDSLTDVDTEDGIDLEHGSESVHFRSTDGRDSKDDLENTHGKNCIQRQAPMDITEKDFDTTQDNVISDDTNVLEIKNNPEKNESDTFKNSSEALMAKALTRNKWDMMKSDYNKGNIKKTAPSNAKYRPRRNVPPVQDLGLNYQYDLRSLPIDLNDHHRNNNKVLNVIKVINAFTTVGKTQSELATIKLQRQEEMLKSYTTVYDIISDRMVDYHKAPKNRRSAALMRERARSRGKSQEGNGNRIKIWVKGLFTLRSRERKVSMGSKNRYTLR